MPRNATYFLSDLHLGARYLDNPREAERRVVDFLKSIEHDCERLYLVGDILDYWYEYRHVVPRGYVRLFGQLARMADDGVSITWLIGNHDIWIFDYIPTELGITVVDGPVDTVIDGKRFYIEHGDRIDDTSLSFRIMRAAFRSRLCQRLYSAVHPRWTIPFATAWSRSSRGGYGKGQADPDSVSIAPFEAFASQYLDMHPDVRYFVFGHLHTLRDEQIGTARLIVLGDWLTHFSYAKYADGYLKLLKYRPNEA